MNPKWLYEWPLLWIKLWVRWVGWKWVLIGWALSTLLAIWLNYHF